MWRNYYLGDSNFPPYPYAPSVEKNSFHLKSLKEKVHPTGFLFIHYQQNI